MTELTSFWKNLCPLDICQEDDSGLSEMVITCSGLEIKFWVAAEDSRDQDEGLQLVYSKNIGEEVQQRSGDSVITSVVFLSEMDSMYIAVSDGSIIKYSSCLDQENSRFSIYFEHDFPITAMAISPDGAHIAFGDDQGTVVILQSVKTDSDTPVLLSMFKGHRDKVTSLCFVQDKSHFVSGGADGSTVLFSTFNRQGPLASSVVPTNRTDDNSSGNVTSSVSINQIAKSTMKASVFASCSDDGKIECWDTLSRNGKTLRPLKTIHLDGRGGISAPCMCVAFSLNYPNYIFAGDLSHTFFIIDVNEKKIIWSTTFDSAVVFMASLASGSSVILGLQDGSLKIVKFRQKGLILDLNNQHYGRRISFISAFKANLSFFHFEKELNGARHVQELQKEAQAKLFSNISSKPRQFFDVESEQSYANFSSESSRSIKTPVLPPKSTKKSGVMASLSLLSPLNKSHPATSKNRPNLKFTIPSAEFGGASNRSTSTL